MKKILILFLLLFSFSNSNSLGLSALDIIILKKIKTLTNDTMMNYTLMALAVKESSVGKYQINFLTNDFGVFQGNIKTVLRRQKVPNNIFYRRYFAQKLLSDFGFATANAIVEINYWRKVHNENWIKVWASYNTGWNYKTKTGLIYSTDVFNIIKKLRYEYNL